MLKVADHLSFWERRVPLLFQPVLAKNKRCSPHARAAVDFCASDICVGVSSNATRATLQPRAVGLLLNFAESWTARGAAYWRGMASGQQRRKIGVEGARCRPSTSTHTRTLHLLNETSLAELEMSAATTRNPFSLPSNFFSLSAGTPPIHHIPCG